MKSHSALRNSNFKILAGIAAFLFLLSSVARSLYAEQHTAQSMVMDLKLDGEVEPILATYIDEGLADAALRNASLVLITMDTPGGLSDSMKDIIQHILASPVPVAVYVSPTGARGASAGFFILMSADVAAMTPGTRTGAASPILAIGGFTIGVDETLRKKIMNDATAFLRSVSSTPIVNPPMAMIGEAAPVRVPGAMAATSALNKIKKPAEAPRAPVGPT